MNVNKIIKRLDLESFCYFTVQAENITQCVEEESTFRKESMFCLFVWLDLSLYTLTWKKGLLNVKTKIDEGQEAMEEWQEWVVKAFNR